MIRSVSNTLGVPITLHAPPVPKQASLAGSSPRPSGGSAGLAAKALAAATRTFSSPPTLPLSRVASSQTDSLEGRQRLGGAWLIDVDRNGQSDRIYHGGKAQHLEGSVRVNAFMRWPGVLKPGSRAQDVAHVTDLYKNPREDRPQDAILYGVGFGAKFVQMLKRHMAMKQWHPDREPGRDVPYGASKTCARKPKPWSSPCPPG